MNNVRLQSDFWEYVDQLAGEARIVIDRPKGSRHPDFPNLVYPVDYGYLEGTSSPDGNEIDVWVGTLEPKRVMGVICTVDLTKRDSEIKVLHGCTEEEVDMVFEAMNTHGMRGLLLLR
ncbi:MAG: inorganic pyrophosphatase [bacterium]|nr:inorganic pyrophosphatase [bacterium]